MFYLGVVDAIDEEGNHYHYTESSIDGNPISILSYASGPGFSYHRMNGGYETARRDLTEDVDTGHMGR